MGKLVVLIDSGFLKYSTRFVARNRLGIDHRAPLAELANNANAQAVIYDVLAASLRSKLSSIEHNFGKIDRCIVCLDVGDSWRTKVTKTVRPDTGEESSIAYKGHRRTDDPEELAAIVQLNKYYMTAIKFLTDNSSIELVGHNGIESDDYMVILGQTYAKQGNQVIVMSKDADITQAVVSYDNGGFVAIMQPQQHGGMTMVVDHGLRNKSTATDIFNMGQPMQPAMQQAIQTANIVAPQYLLLEKILNGDASDDISPVMLRVSNGRNYKLTAKNLATIFDAIAATNAEGYVKYEDLYDNDKIRLILEHMHRLLFKHELGDIDMSWQTFYYNKFVENRKMVCINKAELGKLYDTVLTTAVEQLRGITPTIAFPTWQVLQQLGM